MGVYDQNLRYKGKANPQNAIFGVIPKILHIKGSNIMTNQNYTASTNFP